MAEYIKREAAVSVLLYNQDEACGAVVADMESIPAADVAPVVHARWIEVGFEAQDVFGRLPPVKVVRGYRCSVCNRFERGKEPYCHCGAKMDLRGENDDGSEKA